VSADPLVHGVEEEILGIPRLLALPEGPWAGFRPFPSLEEAHREIARLDAAAVVRPRRELEQDTEWKQPIPYAIALYRDPATAEPFLFWMDRLAGTSDTRLHGRASFGVGGHISPSDGGILAALEREWGEEVATPSLPDFMPLGLLNDESDPVGMVHLGVVFLARLTSPSIEIREQHKLAGALAPVSEAVRRSSELEGWSARLITTIAEIAR
jgi:predicted NUDIX family phosphoesterase